MSKVMSSTSGLGTVIKMWEMPSEPAVVEAVHLDSHTCS